MTLSLGHGELVPQLNKPWRVQGVYSSYHFICLKCRAPGENKFIYIGRGHLASFVSFANEIIPSEFRINDNFKEKIKNEFNNYALTSIDPFDPALVLTFKNKDQEKKLVLSYFERKLFFATLNFQKNVIRGFLPFQKNPIQDFDLNDFSTIDFIQKYFPAGNCEVQSNEQINSLLPYPTNQKKVQKKSERKKQKIEQDILRLKRFIELKNSLIDESDLSAHIKGNKFSYEKISVKVDSKNYYQLRDQIFQKIKNVSKAISIQEQRLKSIKESGDIADKPKPIKPVYRKVSSSTEGTQKITEMNGPDGSKAVMGKSAQMNEFLRSKWARKNDFWFHVANETSAHVFLRLADKQSRPTLEQLEFVGQLYCAEGQVGVSEVDLIYTEVKNLRSVKGKTGSVTYKNEKYFHYRY